MIKNKTRRVVGILFVFLVAACAQAEENGLSGGDAFKIIEWIDLAPKEDLEALLSPPFYVHGQQGGLVQYGENTGYATQRLNLEETTLISSNNVLQRVRELSIQEL